MTAFNKIIFSLTSSLEWFEFSLFNIYTPIFAKIFFNQQDSAWINLFDTYAIFSIGFLFRPIGAVLFGYIGDKYGRKNALKLTPILITCVSVLTALIPTYDQIGLLSIILLTVFRAMQGIIIGGEYAGNMIYLIELNKNNKYLWGSIGSCTASFGIMLASFISALFYNFFNEKFMNVYGWRIAFLLTVPIGIISYFVRNKAPEIKHFISIDLNFSPLKEFWQNYKYKCLHFLGLIYLQTTSFYLVFTYLPIFLKKIYNLKEYYSLLNNSFLLILRIFIIPLFSIIVSKVGGLRSLKYIALIFLFSSIPLFYLLCSGINYIMPSILLFALLTAFNAAITPGLLSEYIPTNIRYTFSALVLNIGFGIFGGTAPMICLLLSKINNNIYPSYYLIFASCVTCFAIFLMRI